MYWLDRSAKLPFKIISLEFADKFQVNELAKASALQCFANDFAVSFSKISQAFVCPLFALVTHVTLESKESRQWHL
jgi:hypothetical protein